MRIVVPDVGEIYCLNRIRSDWNTLFELRLFQNDYNPSADSLVTEFVESTFSGYAMKDLAGQWGECFINTSGEAQMDAPFQTWDPPSSGEDQPIWGVFCTTHGGTALLWAQRMESVFLMGPSSIPFNYIPRFRLRTIVPS